MENRISSFTRIMFVVTFISLIGMGVAMKSCNENRRDNTELVSVIDAMNDTLEVSINTDSSKTARINAFETSRKTLLSLRSKDSTIKALQKLVDKNTKSATVFNSNTNIKSNTKNTITSKDTIIKDSLIYIYPEYRSLVSMGKWVNGTAVSNKDGTVLDLQIRNEFNVVIKKKDKKSVVEVTSMNPYSTLESVRSFTEIPKDVKRIGIGLHVGYGATLMNNEIKLTPVVSVGINYNLINIK